MKAWLLYSSSRVASHEDSSPIRKEHLEFQLRCCKPRGKVSSKIASHISFSPTASEEKSLLERHEGGKDVNQEKVWLESQKANT